MPSSLDLPSIDDPTLVDKIVSERTKNPNKLFFTTYKPDWKIRIAEYMSKFGNAEKINVSTIAAADKDKFINLYTRPIGTLKTNIIDILRDHTLASCPFCSEAGRPTTLDHFLPKEKYPEFSFLSNNLVPACDACQGADAKGSKVLNGKGKRIFLHPYYDIPSGIEIMVLTIKAPYSKGTDFELNVNEELDTGLKKLSKRHLKELNIEDRYRRWFKSEFLRLKKLVLGLLEQGESFEKVLFFLETAHAQGLLKGINYWDTVFYKSVLSNSDLLEFLKNKNNLRI